MKSILDKDFRYVKAAETDIRKTFAKVKKQIEANKKEAEAKVQPMRKQA